MFRAAIMFFVIGLVALLLGASGFAGLSIEIGRWILYAFLVLALISTIAGFFGHRRHPKI